MTPLEDDRLEEELRRSLAAGPPSPGFTAGVMARVRKERRWTRAPLARWALAGAIAASMIAGVALQQRSARLERERAAARDQLLLSLEIASAKFNKVREVVLQVTQEKTI